MSYPSVKRWKYRWLHLPTGKMGVSELLTEMSGHQFLSCLAWWNNEVWLYYPIVQDGILSQHNCMNVDWKEMERIQKIIKDINDE